MANQTLLQEVINRYWEDLSPVVRKIQFHARSYAIHDYQISLEQFNVLRHIKRGVRSQAEIADSLQISRPAVSQVVDLMVEKGLITREQSSDDRRYSTLALSQQGAELMGAIFARNRQWMADNMANLSDEELITLIKAMEIFHSAFQTE